MAEALKDINKPVLLAVLFANLALYYLATQTDSLIGGNWSEAAKNLADGVPAGVGLIIAGILNAQLSSVAKARIVFLRWAFPLPGSFAFSRYAPLDTRIDMTALERAVGPFPSDPKDQNALWYKLFKSVESDPQIVQAHREYLFSRDYHCLSLMMVAVFGIAGFVQIPSATTAWLYSALLVAQFALTGQAARNHGVGLVTSVLALKSVGK